MLSLGAFVAGGVAAVYLPGPPGLGLGSAGLVLAVGLAPSSSHSWPLVAALVILASAAVLGSWLEQSAPLPGGSTRGELARTVAGQLGALATGAMLFGPAAGAGLFAALVGRHYPFSVMETGRYLLKRLLARTLRLLAVALAAALAARYVFAG